MKDVTVYGTNATLENQLYGYFLNIIYDSVEEDVKHLVQNDLKVINETKVVNLTFGKLSPEHLFAPHNLRSGDVVSLACYPLEVRGIIYLKPVMIKYKRTHSFGIDFSNTTNEKLIELFRLDYKEE